MPFYADNKALAIGTALYHADVSSADLDLVLNGVLGANALLRSDNADDRDIDAAYRAVAWLSSVDSESVASVGIAWQYPREVAKAPFAPLRYVSLKDKFGEVAALFDQAQTDVRLSREEWRKSAEEMRLFAQNLSEMGEDRVRELVRIANHLRNAQTISELSVLELRKLYQGLLDCTENVDWKKAYVLDFVCGVGFCYAAGADLAYLSDEIHRLDNEKLVDAFMYLPNKERAVFALVQYLFAERGIDARRVATLCVTLQSFGLVPERFEVLKALDEINYLAACTACPSDAEWQAIAPHVGTFLATITAFE